ncbi:MAG: hypothetical protein RSA67_05285, partial [Alistipes sp.]
RGSWSVFPKSLRPLDKLEDRMIFSSEEIPFDLKKLFEFVTEVILALFLFLFLFCKSDFSELNEDL